MVYVFDFMLLCDCRFAPDGNEHMPKGGCWPLFHGKVGASVLCFGNVPVDQILEERKVVKRSKTLLGCIELEIT
ncbi:hypothetical protein FO488_18540 [Geobacter sp. FeAm09]|uniref:hypothetical protein n=1 Tax=Geobacter sp. FeAm09 TaxID=2597769 RepID=UPI0011EC70F5|nr:hypothetical protein [Geobacter sp. FeAm09]QEM69959.1 hypothetical protein FO488_18540 [Geobacter sp. FeAm09]